MRKWLGGVVVALTLMLAACSGEQTTPQSQNAVVAPAAFALPAAVPTEISIPRIGAKSSLVALGLNADETIQVPPVTKPMQAGWYDKAPTPGEVGPAGILGHVDGNRQPGIFFRLKQLVEGDEVLVDREDGRTVRFVVDRVSQVSKKDFPAHPHKTFPRPTLGGVPAPVYREWVLSWGFQG